MKKNERDLCNLLLCDTISSIFLLVVVVVVVVVAGPSSKNIKNDCNKFKVIYPEN
jgi:hypothetical protein